MGSVVSRLHGEEADGKGGRMSKLKVQLAYQNSCLPSLLISPGLWEKRRLKRELSFILLIFMIEGKHSQLVCLGSSPLPHLLSPSHNKSSVCKVDSLQEI